MNHILLFINYEVEIVEGEGFVMANAYSDGSLKVRIEDDPLNRLREGQQVDIKFAFSDTIGASERMVSFNVSASYGGFLTAAQPVRIRSGGGASDIAGGSGARSILVSGVDNNFDAISEVIICTGASASASTAQSFRRVNRVKVLEVGTVTNGVNGANIGNITIETTSGTLLCVVRAGSGQTQHSLATIPRGKIAFILGLFASSDLACNVGLRVREGLDQAVITPARTLETAVGITSAVSYDAAIRRIVGPADLWFTAEKLGGGTASVSTSLTYEIEDIVI